MSRQRYYDVIITINDIRATNEDEAIQIARKDAQIRDRGYVEINKIN